MFNSKTVVIFATLVGLALLGCDKDSTSPLGNGTETVFDIQVERIETFEDVDIHVEVHEGGDAFRMEHGEMMIDAPGGTGWTHEMEQLGDGFVAHAMFFEPGNHELHFRGRRSGHGAENFGDHMIEVHRQHRLIGDYWAELSLAPAPAVVGTETTVTLHIFELDGQSPGSPAAGLTLAANLHDSDGVEYMVSFVESVAGVYETSQTFNAVGMYELHVTIGLEEGVFHFPVLGSLDDIGTGGHGHMGGGHHGMGL
jgi:hypothetical protein